MDFNLDQYVDFVQASQIKRTKLLYRTAIGIELGYQDYLAEDYKK